MKLSAEQLKTFHRIQRKYNVSAEFILSNMPAILRFVQYATTPHPVLMLKLIRRKNRVFLRYNHLRKLLFDSSEVKKNRRAKRLRLQWSKRLVMHLKSYKTEEFVEDEHIAEPKLHEEDVSKQLKEQLELLKSGKRIVPLLEDVEQKDIVSKIPRDLKNGSCEQEDNEAYENVAHENKDDEVLTSEHDTNDANDSETEKSVKDDATQSNDVNDSETEKCVKDDATQSNQPEPPDAVHNASKSSIKETAPDDAKPTKRLSNGSDRSNGKFLDMLISKVKSTADDVSDANLMEPPKQSVRASGESVQNEERENSNSSSDFFGFDDSERIPGTFPGMLSTPLVQKRDSNAAFESETLDAFLRDNSLESSTTMDLPQRRPEDGLVSTRTIPPKLEMPALPEGLQGLRTVAERRIFLQRQKNVKYCVINNVGTVFRELQKRNKGHRVNKNTIEALQNSSTMPLTRASWKAASWLLTDEGNYYFQTINIDGKDYRLSGSRANNVKKYKRPHSNNLDKLSSVCTENCIDRITFRALRPIRTLERRSKLSDAAKKVVYKACPLSQKIFQHTQDNQLAFDSLEVVCMPQVELEVFPQFQKPLNDIAKRYLQLILPYDGISREWAEFSVSTLLDQEKEELASGIRKSFTFKIPYANDRSSVLVRRVFDRSEAFEGHLDKSTLSFRKEIDDKKANGQNVDDLDEECADILTDMLNSVAISCCENSFLKDDPDNIYQNLNHDQDTVSEKIMKKSVNLHHQHHTGSQYKKQSRMVLELKRLNATIIDAATSKSEEEGFTCAKESCKLGCVCASLNEGTTVRQHCGKPRCILDCNCKCPGIMRLETDGRTITTEDAFMLRRQATAKLARMEKEFTSTIVLTGSETLLINESQYDKKRRCTKIPKRYGDFVDPDVSELDDCKLNRKIEGTHPNLPLEPVMVNDRVYQCLKHCTVNIKRLRDINDLGLWCLVHKVYNCFCKGQATVGNPIVLEKQEELTGGTTTDETAAAKNRTLYSFDKEEQKPKPKEDALSNYDSESNESIVSDSLSLSSFGRKQANIRAKRENKSRLADNEILDDFLNAKPSHCRRVVPIPRNTYIRRNKKRVAHVQLFIAENENEQTKLNLSEHVLRSVYYHKNYVNSDRRKNLVVNKKEPITDEEIKFKDKQSTKSNILKEKRKAPNGSLNAEDVSVKKRSRMSIADVEKGASLLLVNQYKDNKKKDIHKTISTANLPSPLSSSSTSTSLSQEQITIPKISQIFSLNTNASNDVEMGTDAAAAVAADIPKQSTEAAATAGVSSEAFKSVFQVVIRNMNNLVSKKMQDIDMALRRESKSIPVPNDEILCIIRWNNFLSSYLDGFVFLWEVRTASETFIAATVRNVMPLVVGALSVVNIRALSKNRLPLLARMLIERTQNIVTDGLAVVMQGQKMYWYVKGFLRPDKNRVCPKPTPETHPLLTKKINVLCRLLINQQINEHKKRQEVTLKSNPQTLPSPSSSSNVTATSQQQNVEIASRLHQSNISTKLKVLPIQRNISDHAAMILEQMVTQAYGLVQSNVVFRKVYQKELSEICQPATYSLDHHWLVLDISSDFSHIFIPELKDLLTLDRIQKVISYAVNKNRIVKMQFSQKALFNAFVTPLSRRKLYFGPFRSTNHCPRLVLLQSVDGQMMLREIYEKKHNIGERADKTTGFWLIQKRGKVFLEVVPDPQSTLLVGSQDEVQEILDDDVTFVPNDPTNISSIFQQQAEGSNPNNQKDDDDDDDCVIIEDAPSSKDRIHYTISYTGDNSALVVIPSIDGVDIDQVVDANNKFTLLTPSVDSLPTSTPQDGQNSFINSEEFPQQHTNETAHFSINIEDTEHATDSICPILSSDKNLAIVSAIPPGDATESITEAAADEMNSTVEQLPEGIPSTSMKLSEPREPSVPKEIAGPVENEVKEVNEEREKEKMLTNLPPAAMKLNKNVTITKILVDSEHAKQDMPALSRKSLNTPNTLTSKKLMPNSQKRLSVPLTKQTVIKPIGNNISQLNQKLKSQLPSRINALSKQLVVSKAVAAQLNPQQMRKTQTNSLAQPSLLQQSLTGQRMSTPGLVVRTPTAINTYIRTQQQKQDLIKQPVGKQSVAYSLLKPINPGLRMRLPVAANSPRTQTAAAVPSNLKNSSNSDNQSHEMVLKTPPLLPAKVITPKKKQPYTSPQQVQFIRYMKNQAKLVSKLNETICHTKSCGSPQSDPLQITGESSDTAVNDILQPQLPSDVKTVRITHSTLHDKFDVRSTSPAGTSNSSQISGFKRNSTGSILKPSPQSIPKAKQNCIVTVNDPDTVVTPITIDNPVETSEFKGIPIDLPRMKKFAIISSPNTTVITPPTAKLIEENFETPTSSPEVVEKSSISEIQKKKLITNATTVDTLPAISSKSLIKVKPKPLSEAVGIKAAKIENVSKCETEYGYFQANIEGLPKFVVKRINDDFLVKVPSFNGILKLNGLQTVYNYLNQYTTQKCGKSPEDIVNLKWIFKAQDRSKLTSMKTTTQPKQSFNNKVISSTQAMTQSTSPSKTTNNSMAKDPKVKQIDPCSVVLVDDE